MTPAQLEEWVSQGFYDVAHYLSPANPDDWWPPPGRGGQGRATSWGWAAFLRAFDALLGPLANRDVEFGAGWGHPANHPLRQHLLTTRWLTVPSRRHCGEQTLLDFTIQDWNAASPMILAAESEMAAIHGVGDSITGADGYSWDFYKLLLTRCRLRLFLARVGPCDGVAGSVRRSQLLASLGGILQTYTQLSGPEDEVGIVLLPEERAEHPTEGWQDARFGVWQGGALTIERCWAE